MLAVLVALCLSCFLFIGFVLQLSRRFVCICGNVPLRVIIKFPKRANLIRRQWSKFVWELWGL